VIERAVALADSDRLELDDLPPALLDGYTEVLVPSFRRFESLRTWGSRYARMVLERCDNNKRQTCRELGISYHTLQSYLRFRPESVAALAPSSTAAEIRSEGREGRVPTLEPGGVPW
jgi:hypothetical protein